MMTPKTSEPEPFSAPEWKPLGLDLVRLAAGSKRSVWSVSRVYQGRGNAFTRAAVADAAKELGLPEPPAPRREVA